MHAPYCHGPGTAGEQCRPILADEDTGDFVCFSFEERQTWLLLQHCMFKALQHVVIQLQAFRCLVVDTWVKMWTQRE